MTLLQHYQQGCHKQLILQGLTMYPLACKGVGVLFERDTTEGNCGISFWTIQRQIREKNLCIRYGGAHGRFAYFLVKTQGFGAKETCLPGEIFARFLSRSCRAEEDDGALCSHPDRGGYQRALGGRPEGAGETD